MREEAKPVKLPSIKLLVALVVFTLLSSATMSLLKSIPINVVQASPAENGVALTDWSNRNLSRASPEEVRDTVTRIQFIPSEEGLPFEELEMEPDPRKSARVSGSVEPCLL